MHHRRHQASPARADAPAHAHHAGHPSLHRLFRRAHAPGQTDGLTLHQAAFYDVLARVVLLGDERRLRASTVALAGLRPGEQVLEVGCGTGSLAITAAETAGVKVYGTDASPEMIERARRKAARAGVDVAFREGLVEQIAFPDASLDVVLSSFMVHHLPDDLKRRAFAEIHRVLKPGGRVVVVDFEPPQGRLLRTAMTLLVGRGMMRIDNRYLPDLLRTAGFTAIRTGRTDHPLASYASGQKAA